MGLGIGAVGGRFAARGVLSKVGGGWWLSDRLFSLVALVVGCSTVQKRSTYVPL